LRRSRHAAPTPLRPLLSSRWASAATEAWSFWLLVAASGLLLLSSAGTIDATFTLRVSYLLLGAACVVGAPHILRGWLVLAPTIRWCAVGLLLAYATAAAAGDAAVLETQARAGESRTLVYLADLALGLACVGLMVGVVRTTDRLRWLVVAAFSGAAVAALYGLYQWPAQRFDWPFEDVNNTLDSNLVTQGATQGTGIFGWERIRGTFLEPHFLASYLASALPLALALWAWSSSRWRIVLASASCTIVVALLLTSSVPGWASLVLGVTVTLLIASIARGLGGPAALFGGVAAIACVLAVVAIVQPGSISAITGRSEAQLEVSAIARTHQWERAAEIWSTRPVLGYGPGQSSVRLAVQPTASEPEPALEVLRSAQGVWAAALIDAGIVGLAAWLSFLSAVVIQIVRGVVRAPHPIHLALGASAFIAIVASLVAGDRLDLRVWVAIGLALAVCRASYEVARGALRNTTEPQAM
jgi:hypothetical protein